MNKKSWFVDGILFRLAMAYHRVFHNFYDGELIALAPLCGRYDHHYCSLTLGKCMVSFYYQQPNTFPSLMESLEFREIECCMIVTSEPVFWTIENTKQVPMVGVLLTLKGGDLRYGWLTREFVLAQLEVARRKRK